VSKFLFPDNSVVVSFAHANELAILRQYLGDSGRVTEAVSHEIAMSARLTPHLAELDQAEWFGEPIEISGPKSIRAVEGLRVAVFGGTKAQPLQHLGESQTLHLLKEHTEYRESYWLTEDRDAYNFAVAQQITTRDIFGLLGDMVGFTELSADRAFEVAQAILDSDRHLLRVPTSPNDFIK